MALIVFTRTPQPGYTKTRLIPTLGAEGAALLHRALLEHSLATAMGSGIKPVHLAYAEPAPSPILARLAAQYQCGMLPQGNGDLGDRMARVANTVLAQDFQAPVLLMGTDCPSLSIGDIRKARQALTEANGPQVVFIGAEDGGYVLVGFKVLVPELFSNIEWGTSAVLSASLAALAKSGVSAQILSTRYDIDREEDYLRMCAEGGLPNWDPQQRGNAV
jgi:uncharacterized protein